MSVLEAVIIPVAGGMVGLILGRVKKIKWFIALLPLLCMLSAIGLYLSEGIFALICSAGCLYFFQTPINDATDRLLIARLGNNANRFSNYRLGGSGGYGIGALLGIKDIHGAEIRRKSRRHGGENQTQRQQQRQQPFVQGKRLGLHK